MRFQYSLIVNISLMDSHLTFIFAMQLDMNERCVNGFSEKNIFRTNEAFQAQKLIRPHNS